MMKFLFSAIVLMGSFCGLAQTTPKEIVDLKTRRTPDDTSYVYWLPYKHHKKYLLVQGAFSNLSHKGEIALDFKMKVGTTICAARGGVVESMHEESDRGGNGNAYINDGNFVIIRHSDGSRAMYWHLQKNGVLVNPGDTVKQGQEIGLSGNTGYSAFPHLHFEVQGVNNKGEYTQIPVRFRTKRGDRYLRPLRSYKALHK
jgi:murein DD-endopeptidase MepM/ murein hydrolase activator NlpD